MTTAQQLLATPDFDKLPLDVQNRLLIQALLSSPTATEPQNAPAPTPLVDTQTIQQQGVIVHQNGQPFLMVPLNNDPTGGIATPVSQLPTQQVTSVQGGPDFVSMGKQTLSGVGDGLKTTVGLGLGLIGTLANLAVDVVTLGQSNKSPQQPIK